MNINVNECLPNHVLKYLKYPQNPGIVRTLRYCHGCMRIR